MKQNIRPRCSGNILCRMAICLTAILTVGVVHAETVSYVLDDVILDDGEQITGRFNWTYDAGDFEGGDGVFTALEIPWTPYSMTDGNLNITIQTNSIEISGNGNFHDMGLDVTLFFISPFMPAQSSLINTDTSKFECCGNGFHDGVFVRGGILPFVLGDLTGEGVVDIGDLVVATRILLGYITPTSAQTLAMDVGPLVSGVSQPDGILNAGDLLLITRKVFGLVNF